MVEKGLRPKLAFDAFDAFVQAAKKKPAGGEARPDRLPNGEIE